MRLHDDADAFIELMQASAEHFQLPEVYLEKDYWVSHCLRQLALSDYVDQVVFKGGTSLSKAYNVIHRFSEDIDLAFLPQDLTAGQIKGRLKAVERVTAGDLTPLRDDDRQSKGSKFRKTVYEYPRHLSGTDFGQASPHLLIEINSFTTPSPYQSIPLQTMVAEFLVTQSRIDLIEDYGLQSFEVNVLAQERTLLEKILAMVRISYEQDIAASLGPKVRHLYDIAMLMRIGEMRAFVSGEEFEALCRDCMSDEADLSFSQESGWLRHSLSSAPLFSQFDEWWSRVDAVYRNDFSTLVHGELPEPDEIGDALKLIQARLELLSI